MYVKSLAAFLLLCLIPSFCVAQCINGQCPQPISFQSANASVPEWAVQATCKVTNWHGGTGSGGTGTVVLIDGKFAFILTCRHVVENGNGEIKVRLSNNQPAAARYLGVSPDGADITVLEISSENVPLAIPVSSKSVVPGEAVCQVGWGGGRLNQRVGRVIGTNSVSNRGWRSHWNTQISFPAISGDSGSGVFDIERKELVGVLWGGRSGTSEICGPEYCQKALEYCLRKRKPGGSGGGGVPMQPSNGGGVPPPSFPPSITNPTAPSGPPAPAVPAADGCKCDNKGLAAALTTLTDAVTKTNQSVGDLSVKVGSIDQRLTVVEGKLSGAGQPPTPSTTVPDPAIKQVQDELAKLKATLAQGGTLRVTVTPK